MYSCHLPSLTVDPSIPKPLKSAHNYAVVHGKACMYLKMGSRTIRVCESVATASVVPDPGFI
jgi:hypothetical protein